MKKEFIKGIYDSIVQENLNLDKELFESTHLEDVTDDYWKEALSLFNALPQESREILFKIIEQTMIDTISNMFGIIDGSSTLEVVDELELKLLIDGMDTENELQDLFLKYIEEIKA